MCPHLALVLMLHTGHCAALTVPLAHILPGLTLICGAHGLFWLQCSQDSLWSWYRSLSGSSWPWCWHVLVMLIEGCTPLLLYSHTLLQCGFVCFGLISNSIRNCSDSAQELLMIVFRKLYVVPGIQPGLATCQATTLPTVLYFLLLQCGVSYLQHQQNRDQGPPRLESQWALTSLLREWSHEKDGNKGWWGNRKRNSMHCCRIVNRDSLYRK